MEADRPAIPFDARLAARFAGLTVACFALVLLGFGLAQEAMLPPMMPMTGVAMAGMLLWGKQLWPAVPVALLLALAVERLPDPVPLQILIAISLTIGPVVGVLVTERLIGRLELPARAEHTLPIILGAAASSVVMAACASVPMALHGSLHGTPLALDLVARGFSYLTGALVTLPLVLAWLDGRPDRWSASHWLHFAGVLVVTGVTGHAVFLSAYTLPIAWAVYPPLIWAALVFRMRGLTAAMLLVTVQAFAGSAMGLGVFANTPGDSVPLTLVFVSVTAGTMLVFAALAHERLSERRLRLDASDAREVAEIARGDLVDAHARLRLAQEAAGTIAWEYDVDAARLARAFGDSESIDLMTGQRPRARCSSDFQIADLDAFAAAVHKAVAGKAVIDLTMRTDYDDRPPAWHRVVGRYDETHKRRRVIGMSIDVTALHEARAAAQAATDKLLSISRLSAMGAMASTLAHELNQPLTAIANYAASCRMLLSSDIPDGRAMAIDHLVNLTDASLRAGKIIRKMRDFTISGEISRTREDMEDIVRAAWSNVHDRPVAIGVTLDVTPGRVGAEVAVDRLQIEQVLINLLLNAVEATAGQEARRITVRVSRNRHYIRVAVADNGPGLPPDMIAHLFEPFRTTKPDGTGLGLPICRTIVEAHGGRLWAEQPASGGSAFVFTITAEPLV